MNKPKRVDDKPKAKNAQSSAKGGSSTSNAKKQEDTKAKDRKIIQLEKEIKLLKLELDVKQASEFYKETGIDPQAYMLYIYKCQVENLELERQKFVRDAEAAVSSDTFEDSVKNDTHQSHGEIEVQNLEKGKKELEDKLVKANVAYEEMKQTVADREILIQDLQKKLESVNKDLQEKTKECNDKNEDYERLKREAKSNLEKELKKTNEDILKTVASKEKLIQDLQNELQVVKNDLQEKTKECSKKSCENERLKREANTQTLESGTKQSKIDVSKEVEENNKTVKDLEKENGNLQDQLKKLQSECERYKNSVQEEVKKVSKAEKQLSDKTKEFEENIKKYETIQKENDMKIQKLENEKSALTKQRKPSSARKGNRENNDQMSEDLVRAKEEISELKNRLSKVVGAKVMDDNPNITDLSDENRPTKLSEKYSELYDNEWTDAYEEGEKSNKTEIQIIQELYKDLTDINDFCQSLAMKHSSNIQSSILTVTAEPNQKPTQVKPGIDVTHTRLLKELRKSFAPLLVDSVFELYCLSKKINWKDKPKKEKFAREVTRLCWLMASQDPPVVLETKEMKGDFDGDRFRTYTKTGKKFDFVVWPPMLLHKDGPLLSKGVAQAK